MTSSRSSVRPLGFVKANRGIVFPPLPRSGESGKNYHKEHRLSIQGDGMIAHQRSLEKEETPRAHSSRPHTSKSDPNHKSEELLKEYQVREKQYKNRIQSLQKVIEQLKNEIVQKQEEIDALYIKIKKTEETYKALYEDEKQAHDTTKTELANVKHLVTEKMTFIEELKLNHEKHISEMDTVHKTELNKLETDKNKEIADRDEKINKLKIQMGSILKDNSWERQQQLEELSKELNKISEEANMLRAKLKKHSSKQKNNCEGCVTYKSLVDQKTKKIDEQKMRIAHLMMLGKKVETQLVQQDVLLKQFAIQKGFKTNYQPK